jgi:predicted amino acid racemase
MNEAQPDDGASYPLLMINLRRVEENARAVAALCAAQGIALTGVVKGASGLPEVALAMARGGCARLGSSRLKQLKGLREAGIRLPLLLLRTPGPSEVRATVAYADLSLQSELSTLRLMAAAAEAAAADAAAEAGSPRGKRHGVVLMQDLGDLREGWFDPAELEAAAIELESSMPSLELLGVGVNLGCYGAIRASEENLSALAATARRLEQKLGRSLPIVSGGATSSLPLLLNGGMPAGISDLRVGEGILTALDLPSFHACSPPGVRDGAFTLRAEVLEVREKPSYPIGAISVDAFGETPLYEDRGLRRRAILGAGKRDFGKHEALSAAEPGVEPIGSSSDHLICDVTDCARDLAPGDTLDFSLRYQAMLYASDCPDIGVRYLR